jgi:signal transduction histidine kinase
MSESSGGIAMMEPKDGTADVDFPLGGGELGRLTREYERRLRTLREIGSRTTPARSVETVCQAALAVMAEENPADLPSVLLYLASGEDLRLAGHYGANPREEVLRLNLSGGAELASAVAALRRGESREIPADALIRESPERLDRFDLLPITTGEALAGALAVGWPSSDPSVSAAHLRADCSPDGVRLRQFLELVASQVSKGIAAAQTLAGEREEARRKDEFLAMLAHELRNPLAPIANASELLLHAVQDGGRARIAIEMIRRQVLYLTRMVDDLLDVSRITQGRIQLQRVPVDIAHVIAQAIETVESFLREKRSRLSTTTSSYELYVEGDLSRLVQCVVNVLANAIKYTDTAGEIRVQTRPEGQLAVIEISDNGVGIAPQLLPRIFDLFVQGDRALDRAQGGLGIGLSVVKRLIEMHKGEVIAASPGIGLGATLQIRLPRIDRPQPQPSEAPEAETPPKRVLVVDDNADAAECVAMLLALQGHEARVALSGREALEAVEAFRPDIALLDLGLPNLDGYELATQLRAMPQLRGIRLVALTGYGRPEDRQRTQAVGFDDHLVKPVDLAALTRALSHWR